MANPVGSYSDYVIYDISASFAEQIQTNTLQTSGSVPVVFTIDGPLSLKGTNLPYTMTASKIKL